MSYGGKSSSGRVAPDGSYVCQLKHVCCCGEQAGQAAHKALTRYSSWSSRLRNGSKQRQEQQSAAWAWHYEWRNFAGAHRPCPSSAPPSLGQGGEDGRSVGRGVSACCDSRMHCAHLHGCAHPSRASHAALLQRWQPKRSKLYAMSLHIKGPKH